MKKKLFFVCFVLAICFGLLRDENNILADAWQQEQETEWMEYKENLLPYLYGYEVFLNKKGECPLEWTVSLPEVPEGMELSYEVQVSKSKKFQKAKEFTTKDRQFVMNKEILGKQGGTFYFRVRTCMSNVSGGGITGDWSETREMTFLAITKKNFPGIYKLLKKGGRYYGMEKVEKIVYDQNKDGWLDESELLRITQLGTVNISKKKNGIYHSVPYLKMSGLEGVEHLPNLSSIHLSHYSGTKVDLSKNKVQYVWITGVTATNIEVIAPDAKEINIEAHYDTKMKKMDFRTCKNARNMWVYGANKTKKVYLPKYKKNLKVLSMSELSYGELNLNGYTNLQQIYLYRTKIDKLKINKCKDLRYLYFYFVDSIKNVDVTGNKKLRGMDIYSTPTLTGKTVKYGKKTKVTWQKGKWWYDTDAYKKDMQNLLE